ncbi:MAG: hypothetical protein D6731_23815 [Planctomycetota bacterium]|nr:MAG: hypothetical protein D6731_23815 [Planctomycetota bacterium]
MIARAHAYASLLLCLGPATSCAGGSTFAGALDDVTVPGAPARLRAKLEGRLGRDVVGVRVLFEVGRKRLEATTDRDGLATAAWAAAEPGVYAYRARRADRPSAAVARARIFVVPRRRPLAIVDIDGTLSTAAGPEVLLRGGADAPTFSGAPELLRDLARRYQLVYLTARDDAFLSPTRRFLARHRFPPGPVLFNDWGFWDPDARAQLRPSRHGEFKLRVLRGLAARGLRLALGIGNAETDAEAYEAAGLRSCIRREGDRVGRRSFCFADYGELRRRLVAEGFLEPSPGEGASAAAARALREAPRRLFARLPR